MLWEVRSRAERLSVVLVPMSESLGGVAALGGAEGLTVHGLQVEPEECFFQHL